MRALAKFTLKILGAVFLFFCVALAGELGLEAWLGRNQLAKYGPTYEHQYGEHQAYQTISFNWDPQHRVKPPFNTGPFVTDDELYLRFRNVEGESAPQIVVRSEVYQSHRAIFRLNFTDPRKPEIELMENRGMGIEYPPPWSNYYQRDRETGGMRPTPTGK